jgi:hypothetical protein
MGRIVGSAKIELGWKLDHQRSFETSRPSRLRVIPGSEILAREAAKIAKEERDRGLDRRIEWRLGFLKWIHGENSWFRED